jgi:RHS repeat-associated protein
MKSPFRITILVAFLGLFSYIFTDVNHSKFNKNEFPTYSSPNYEQIIDTVNEPISAPVYSTINIEENTITDNSSYAGKLNYKNDKTYNFTINIDELITTGYNAYIEYEYWGVSENSIICQGINDNLSFGGYILKRDTLWHKNSERIPVSQLTQGKNTCRLSIPEKFNSPLYIRNLQVVFKKENTSTNSRQIHISNNGDGTYFHDYAYIHGFITGEDSENAIIYINGKESRKHDVEFEDIIEKPSDKNETWITTIEAVFPDGERIQKEISFNKNDNADYIQSRTNTNSFTSRSFNAYEEFLLEFNTASIYGYDSSFYQNFELSITSLNLSDFPALSGDMVNLTEGASAYRFLPHGMLFEKDAYITIGYNEEDIPSGFSVDDIVTYYYDENEESWIPLEKDSIDVENKRIISKTNHFTDFINAIIKVPESPDGQAFVPTSLKDMEYANPMSGVNVIQPPSANNNGTTSLSYPLQIPAGRNGMQPQLAVSYSSDAGTGWLGEGWNIQMPAITIDTRWGVPRYNTTVESESYLVNGEQVLELDISPSDTVRLPLVHMETFRNRNTSSNTTIYSYRVEGAFHRIIRHGTTPSNYCWEVIDKQGTHYYYGKYYNDSGVNSNCILSGTDGIAHWALAEVRDVHGNYMTYHYTKSTNNSNGVAGDGGIQLTLDSINYTGYAANNGDYKVEFNSLVNLNKTISGRNGFLEFKDKFLTDIVIKYNNQFVRKYYFKYKPGVYQKKLLESIADITDSSFSTKNVQCVEPTQYPNVLVHCFDYYEEDSLSFGSSKDLFTINEDPQGLFGGLFTDPSTQSLGKSKSTTASLGGSICFGVGSNFMSKINSIGLNLGGSLGTLKEKIQFMDLNGDGITDKIVRHSSNYTYYQGSLNSLNEVEYTILPETLSDLPNLGKNWSKSFRIGGELLFRIVAIKAKASYVRTWNTQITRKYFADVNGDGYVDYIDKGKVYFNFPNTNDKPEFYAQTNDPVIIFPEDTCYSILFNGQIDPAFSEDAEDSLLLNKRDPVKVFIARTHGVYDISGTIQRINTNSSATIYYTIQKNDVIILCDSILPNDTTVYSTNINVNTEKGDLIFFRMHSDDQNAVDEVIWDPLITESYMPNPITDNDADEKHRYEFLYSEDAVIHDKQYFIAPFSGNIVLSGNLNSPQQSDSLQFLIKHNQTALINQQYADAQAFDQNFNYSLSINEGDSILLKLLSNTNVNWNDIGFTAKILYYSIDGQAVDTSSSYYTVDYYPSLQMSLFPHFIQPSNPNIFPASTYEFVPQISSQIITANFNGSIVFTAKTRRKLLDKRILHFVNGTLQGGMYANSLQFTLTTSDTIYFDFYSNDIASLNTFWSGWHAASKIDENGNLIPYTAGVSIEYPEDMKIFGNLYRGWGQFSYLDTSNLPCNPIDTSALHIDFSMVDTTAWANFPNSIDTTWTIDDITAEFDALGMPDVNSIIFSPMFADRENDKWIDFCKSAYVEKEIMGSASLFSYLYDMVSDTGVFDVDDQDIPDFDNPIPQSSGGLLVLAPNKKTRQNTDAFTFKFGLSSPGSLSASVSFTTSKSFLDYRDMNGDRYPDIVGKQLIQYSPPQGGISNKKQIFTDKEYTSFGRGYSIGLAAGVKGVLHTSNKTTGPKSSKVQNITGSAGIGANYGSSNVHYIYIDINGDGLPDRINQKDNTVFYNTGYDFQPEQSLSTLDDISKSSYIAESANLSTLLQMNKDEYSWAFGIGGGVNTSKEKISPFDINNDGLVDICYIEGGDLKAYINTGNGFYSETMATTIDKIAKTKSTNLSADIAATFGVPIFVCKVTASLYTSVSHSFSINDYRLSDVNGDGFVDQLYIDGSTVKVKYGVPKKTNILQKVTTPTHSTYTCDYERTYPSRECTQSKWVMASLVVYDGFNGDGVDNTYYTYSYYNPIYHRMEREFFGYEIVTTNQNNPSGICYRSTEEKYHNDNFLFKGLKISELIRVGKDKYVETQYLWDCKEIRSGSVIPNCGAECFGPVYPAISEENNYFYEGLTNYQIHTLKTYIHGFYGNVKEYENHGDVTDNTDNIKAEISYTYDIVQHFLAMVDEMNAYDYQNNLLTNRIATYNPSGKPSSIGVYDGSNYATTEISYDQYGNTSFIKYPSDINGDNLNYTFQYDPVLHTYPIQITDFWGHSSSTTYDYRLGLPLVVTDPTGNQMQFTYYVDGKLETVTGPKEIASGAPYTIHCDYWTNQNTGYTDLWAVTRHYDPINIGNEFITSNINDGIGRTVQTKKTATINGVDSVVISGRVDYDYYWRAVSASQPATEVLGNYTDFTAYTPTNLSTISYDVIDRPLTQTTSDNRTMTYTYGFGSDAFAKTCFETSITDPENNTITQFKDARGLQTSVTAPLNTTTKFTYSPLGQLMSSTDPENNTTSYKYDMLGRLTVRTHPDANNTLYTYDQVGNILTSQTANLQQTGEYINYIYEDCRLSEIQYPQNPELNVKYAYGTTGNETARLVLLEDASGLQSFSYGNIGEIVQNTRSFVMPHKNGLQAITFEMRFEYDSWNRTKSITYADGEEVNYDYDNGGQLKAMHSNKSTWNYDFVYDIQYNKYGQRTLVDYANSIRTTYSYHPQNQRLIQLHAVDQITGDVVQDVQYGYDNADNITGVQKTADRGVNGQDYYSISSYNYDDLYRLTTAWQYYTEDGGALSLNSNQYSLSYSPSGNILNKTVNTDTYQNGQTVNINYNNNYNYNNRPHTLSNINGTDMEFKWDQNGNMTQWTDNNTTLNRQMIWDEENRLKHVYDEDNTLSSYMYDGGGERTLKLWSEMKRMRINGNQSVNHYTMRNYTLYTSPYMVLTSQKQYTKHYYIESDRVVTKIGGGMANNIHDINDPVIGFDLLNSNAYKQKSKEIAEMLLYDYDELGIKFAKLKPRIKYWTNVATQENEDEVNIYFYHKDHLGSSTQISDKDANIIQHIEYLPYGENFFERHSTWNTPYKFNAKELDEETGMYYYGARYYTPDVSIWLSVDPLADKYPNMSSFMYCAGNPVGLIDPDGRSTVKPDGFTLDNDGNFERVDDTGGSEYDVIYDKEKYDAGNRDYDETGTKSGIRINRKDVLLFRATMDLPVMYFDAEVGTTNSYTLVLSNSKAARKLFEFSAKITQNRNPAAEYISDYTGAEFFIQDYKKGNSRLSVISTDGMPTSVTGTREWAEYYNSKGWSLISGDHNHPTNDPKASGNYPGANSGDIPNKHLIQEMFPNAKFNIYIPKNNYYVPY